VPKALSKDDAAYVGGSTALSVDFAATTGERMPILILTVLVLAFLLLMIAFRSILVPLKAALLTLLPVGAGMGVLVLVFQEGLGAETLGISASTPIFAYVPMLLFAIVFGLSIDYEVFLMSRVKEAEEHSDLEPREAVVTGIQSIARVVVAAATIMTAVFIAFFIQPDINVKMLALGLATAIVCEALVIAFAVSPAVMVLLGRHAWHLPPWLDRLLPNIDVEGSAPEVEPEPAPTPQSA
jgi:RND superfamily putative drug exporter